MATRKSREKPANDNAGERKYKPAVSFPLPFDQAIEGLLAVKPDAPEKPAEKKGKRKA